MMDKFRSAERRSRRTVGGALVVAMAFIVIACSDSGATDPPGGSGPGSVDGVVARNKTGEGVPGVVIAALYDDQVVATTHSAADGTWAIQGLSPGSYRIAATGTELAGLDLRYDALEPLEHEVDVVAGDPESLVFAVVGLIPTRITGEVTCGGTPQVGATIRVIGGSSDVTAITDSQGRFAALDLYPGNYAVLPVDPPCGVLPEYHAMSLRQGEFGEADFAG